MTEQEDVERAIVEAILRAVDKVKDETSVEEILSALQRGDLTGAVDAVRMEIGEHELEGTIPRALRSALESAGHTAATALTGTMGANLAYRFDVLNPETVAWLREEAAGLISDFGSSSLEAIRSLIAQAYEDRNTAAETARMIRESGIGLTERQLNALERFRVGLENETGRAWTQVQVDSKVATYADRLLRDRAKLIARTETLRASREGSQALWRQMLERGLIDADVAVQEWMTSGGDNVCPECEELEGETVAIGENFSAGVDGPPLHPACSCTLSLLPLGPNASGDEE